MQCLNDITCWAELRANIGVEKSLGFVPTMGNLHAGHQSLLRRSVAENDITVLSIYVNPTQFDNSDDLARYPKTVQQDLLLAERLGVDYVILPSDDQIYPKQNDVVLNESNISRQLEGACRDGHFSGVLTIVMKLFMLVKPQRSYFGEKDYQQYLLIKKMAEAFFLEVRVLPCAIVRDEFGLALSSRNSRLNEQQLARARLFAQLLRDSITAESAKEQLEVNNFNVDYVADQYGRRLAAVYVDDIRLIDNIKLKEVKVPC
jgi:pantoate--beta-alanine ligase